MEKNPLKYLYIFSFIYTHMYVLYLYKHAYIYIFLFADKIDTASPRSDLSSPHVAEKGEAAKTAEVKSKEDRKPKRNGNISLLPW